jgi:phage N-6-adenine-methyltransferase
MSRAHVAIVQSVFDFAIREINALEDRIVCTEAEADAMLWEQARQVVAQLEAGLTQRQLAAQWFKTTGEPYSQMHVSFTARVFREKFTFQPRPRFRDAYHAIANGGISNKVNRLLHQSGNYEWFTPPDVVQAARDVLGTIDLDPASCELANTVVHAAKIYTAEDNGLDQPWQGRVFLNPPYRQPEIKQFCEKFARHAEAREIQGIVLVNNATDTQWFATIAAVAHAFCFPSFRFRYWHPENQDADTALQGQVIVYTGPDRDAFCRRFSEIGLVLVRPRLEGD